MNRLSFILYFIFFNLCIFAKNAPFGFYELKGEQEGSGLLVIGGIHGDEPGAYFAPALLSQYYTIKKGNVYVIPNLNPDSILAFRRGVYKDMNRKFVHIDVHDPDYENVERVKKIIKDDSVDFVVNLHDGHGFYRQKWENSIFNPKAWGQTYVIDQKTINSVKFSNLDDIAKQMEIKLNENLHYDFHIFGVRNTETKIKDEEQQNSLTFFAITNFKPALAIETSKNINELDLKVFYQLSSIEALMDILGIEYERNFVMTLEGIREKISEYGTLNINNNIALDLKGIKPALSYFPLK
ncbi:MAG: succinylglutamate desuccinylase/aspartoacylase family protein, partial [Helicobacter sp.]|nr:succinylglutamate desuccinylase/aspartoacylase family protein [Helicobacter sp.]